MPNNKYNMIGKKFGRLTVLEECKERSIRGYKLYKCQCDCGNICYVAGIRLRNKETKSCGCLKHGKSTTKIYKVYSHMKARCYNKNNKDYKYYGGRGITICDEWLNDFMSFYDWAYENGYDDNLTIDRIDVNGNYEPNNCRWIDMKQQCNNRRSCVYLAYNGKTQSLMEWARELNVNYDMLRQRKNRGWSIHDILFGKGVN